MDRCQSWTYSQLQAHKPNLTNVSFRLHMMSSAGKKKINEWNKISVTLYHIWGSEIKHISGKFE